MYCAFCLLIGRLVAYVKAGVRCLISGELHVRASVARRFWWSELNAWPEDLPAGSTILLSGKVCGASDVFCRLRFDTQLVHCATKVLLGCMCVV